ncbi:hypothetical protein D9M72_381690 [compost metagenome]
MCKHRSRKRLEEPLALPVFGKRRRRRQSGLLREEFGQQARDLGQPQSVELADRATQARAAQPTGHRRKCELSLGRIGARMRHGDALLGQMDEQFLRQARFADAGFAQDQDKLLVAQLGTLPDFNKPAPFAMPANHWQHRIPRALALH